MSPIYKHSNWTRSPICLIHHEDSPTFAIPNLSVPVRSGLLARLCYTPDRWHKQEIRQCVRTCLDQASLLTSTMLHAVCLEQQSIETLFWVSAIDRFVARQCAVRWRQSWTFFTRCWVLHWETWKSLDV